ncbi:MULTISPECIES: PPE family protein [Mycobacterium avium complex (MAC)]|uniref:PPE family protein n=2 Tax=Mycobacterium intracellulare TaxID=1767 RepID=A0AAE4RGX0_MYCIT|nr:MULTISPECIES: PPE family protein [Mycobacterium avium complex (MAC)]AFS14667.1 PPE family protein [Mycobacterium intracellulare subsp. intracellulare MTCC 9506]MCA2321799.1 PPE family protein [Mycobacterium intracellulare]MCA2342209.1 PPE family protein [Mycobacterium intracellulare]MDV6976292.1 PPE family protein [Mycobacterium intracellulare]MDV6981345.1 PPE family protein [Mycobacterium intracellulare]
MLDFGAYPPEFNSGRMYVGAGSGPLLAAAAAWDELAAELQTTGASYGSTIETLATGPWTGPSSLAMAAAAAPYVAWMHATGAQAEEAGARAKLAAGAYEAAFAATVPPPVIAANRALLAMLVATNILGQNTPAIAATEAHYMEMWAQDAAAMYGYAASSASASALTPFAPPPRTTNDSAGPTQAAAVAQSGGQSGSNTATQLSQLSGTLQPAAQSVANAGSSGTSSAELTTPSFITNWNEFWSVVTGVYSPQSWTTIPGGPFLSFGQAYAWGQNGQGAAAYLAGPKAISGALAPLTSGANAAKPMLSSAIGAGQVSGSMGKAALVGGMSVPQGWTEAAPAIRTLAQGLPTNLAAAPAALAGEEGVFSQMALSSLAGRAVAAAATRPVGGAATAMGALGGVAAEADPAAATIIVIPCIEE